MIDSPRKSSTGRSLELLPPPSTRSLRMVYTIGGTVVLGIALGCLLVLVEIMANEPLPPVEDLWMLPVVLFMLLLMFLPTFCIALFFFLPFILIGFGIQVVVCAVLLEYCVRPFAMRCGNSKLYVLGATLLGVAAVTTVSSPVDIFDEMLSMIAPIGAASAAVVATIIARCGGVPTDRSRPPA